MAGSPAKHMVASYAATVARPWWAALFCALVTVLLPADAFGWSCDEVPASMPSANTTDVGEPESQLLDCDTEGKVPAHLLAAVCTLDGASEVAPLPLRASHDGEFTAPWRCPELVVSFMRPADDAPSYTPPNAPADAILSLLPEMVTIGYAYELPRRPVVARATPAHVRTVYRPPRS